jgi:hypothetical protein
MGDMTPQKHSAATPHDVDLSWFIRWVLITSVAAGVAPMLRVWLGGQTNTLVIAGVGAAVTYGAQAYELPHPLRGDWWRWVLYGVVGTAIGAYFVTDVIRVLLPLATVFGRATYTFGGILANTVLVVVAQWTVLRFYSRRAWVWLPVMLAGMVVTIWLYNVIPYLRLPRNEAFPILVNIIAGLPLNVAAGGGLWWLFRGEQSSD